VFPEDFPARRERPACRDRGTVVIVRVDDHEFGIVIDGVRHDRPAEAGEQGAAIHTHAGDALPAAAATRGVAGIGEAASLSTVVVKPIGGLLAQIGLYAGATVLGDGGVVLILDLRGMLRAAELPPARDADPEAPADAAVTLLRNADTAMYRAKSRGRGRCELFTEDMRRDARERVALTAELERALASGQLSIVHQPVVSSHTSRVVGTEALLRWHHPLRGTLTPPSFLELAEDSGSIGPIGDWVVRSACRDAQSWITAGHFDRSFRVHVNVSARQLGDAQFVDRTLASVRESGLEPSNLVLEISEKTMLADNPAVTRALSALKRSGVRIAIDDFGTGYSSLAHLRDFPADYLKLDGSLVRDLGQQGGDDPIVRSIIQLAHSLGRVGLGFLFACLVAVPLGFVIGMSPLLYRALDPFIQVLKPISPLAWMPLALYTIKDSSISGIFVIFICSVWPMLINTAFGVAGVRRDWLNVAKTLEVSPLRKAFQVILPAAAPTILTGMRISMGIAWLVIVAAEMLVGGTGVGYFVWNEWNNLALTNVIFAILVIGVVGMLLDALFAQAQKAVTYVD